jgi:hypothetical protein
VLQAFLVVLKLLSTHLEVMLKTRIITMFLFFLSISFMAIAYVAYSSSPKINGCLLRIPTSDAEVPGQWVSVPGTFDIRKNTLIEIDFSYAATPDSSPNSIETLKVNRNGVIKRHALGTRKANCGNLGALHLVFFFKSKKCGNETIILLVDGISYEYHFNVVGCQ